MCGGVSEASRLVKEYTVVIMKLILLSHPTSGLFLASSFGKVLDKLSTINQVWLIPLQRRPLGSPRQSRFGGRAIYTQVWADQESHLGGF